MDTEFAISVREVAKKFRLFSSPKERLIEALHPFRKQYHHEFWALSGVSFDVRRGEIVGILGRNGSGKSTLLQIICSVMQATRGEVKVNGRISALLELGAGFNPEFTGRENVILNGAIMGIPRSEMLRRLPEIEGFADIGEFFDQPVKTYSSGMYVRVAFAAAIHVDPEILIVDEALSVGDAKFQHKCFERIRSFIEQGKTILFVSHSMETLLRLCTSGIVIDHGQLVFAGRIRKAIDVYSDLLYGNPGSPVTASAEPSSNPGFDEKYNYVLSKASSSCQDRIVEKENYNKFETRLGNQTSRIIDFDIFADGKLNPRIIEPHQNVQLLVTVYFIEATDNVSLAFGLTSIDGTNIGGTNASLLKQELLDVAAGEFVTVSFDFKPHLVGGEYFLNLGCHRDADGEKCFLDVRRAVAKLTFAPTDCVGFVDLEVSLRVTKRTRRVGNG